MYVIYAVLDEEREYIGCAENWAQLRKMIEEGVKDGTMMFGESPMRYHEQVRDLRNRFWSMGDDLGVLNQNLRFAEVQEMNATNQDDVISTMAGTLFNGGPLSFQCGDAITDIIDTLKKNQRKH